LAVAAEELGANGAYFRVREALYQLKQAEIERDTLARQMREALALAQVMSGQSDRELEQ
jgi:hypothetical protein